MTWMEVAWYGVKVILILGLVSIITKLILGLFMIGKN